MVGLTTAAKNAMLDGMGITKVSLHTADPGQDGSNEVTGGTYAQKNIAFNAASGGNLDSSDTPVFDVPAGVTINHVGFWAGVVFKYSSTITPEAYGAAGTYTLNDADIDLNK